MRTRSRTVAAGLAVVALLATSVMGMSSASAEVHDIAAPLTGELTVNGESAALPAGGSAIGIYDDDFNVIAVSLVIPDGQISALVDGDDAVVTYRLLNAMGVTGTVHPDGSVTASGNFVLQVHSAKVSDYTLQLWPCSLGPISMTFTGTMLDGVLTLSAGGFEIPATEDSCGDLTDSINGEMSGTNNAFTFSVALGDEIPAPTVPEESEETTTTTEPAGEPGTATTEPTTDPTGEPGTTTPPAGTGTPGATAPAAGAQPVAGTASYTG